jgi:hypothetical protein
MTGLWLFFFPFLLATRTPATAPLVFWLRILVVHVNLNDKSFELDEISTSQSWNSIFTISVERLVKKTIERFQEQI